ncbi:MAG: type III pantothenate kinase [Ruminococcus sp.]|nr:type III pantothenate kinase [Ruminococcus sp.]
MVLAINIGNTNFTLSGRQKDFAKTVRHKSEIFKSVNDFRKIIEETLSLWNIKSETVVGVIISSVNPFLENHLKNAVNRLFSLTPLIVNTSMNMELNLSHYDTSLIGSDRIVVCEAAIAKYNTPFIVCDFGTATTINVVDSNHCFIGGSIIPGVMVGIKALTQNTAQLPFIELSTNQKLIGRNTEECITSGAVFGNAAMLEGIVLRIENLLNQKINIIITGGNAEYILPACERKIIHEPNLLTDGLYILYHRNL